MIAAVKRRTFLAGMVATPLAWCVACESAGAGNLPPSGGPTSRRALRIPPLAPSRIDAEGRRAFELTAAAGKSELVAGIATPTWGYSGSVLGPTLRVKRGETVYVRVRNDLPDVTTVHWHGMHVPAEFDGGPHQPIDSGAIWEPTWTIDQPAATLWYHPHPHGDTEKQVYRGLAGLFLIDDSISDAVDLPKDYGVDDIPVIVQDRRLNPDGSLDETDSTQIGLLGDVITVNGMADVYLPVRSSRVRLRLLNASSGRTYNFGFADDRQFHMVASDGGLLAAPASLRRIQLSPAERAEIVTTMSGSSPVMLKAFPCDGDAGLNARRAQQFGVRDSFDILELRPQHPLEPPTAQDVPAALAALTPIDVSEPATARRFELNFHRINHQLMDMSRIDFGAVVDTSEVWTLINVDDWPHNFHVHDTQFQVLDVDGSPPPAPLSGWKDTVYLPPGVPMRIAVRFDRYTNPQIPYMYHCHLLFHEDQGMMGQFVVVNAGDQPPAMSPSPHGDATERHHDHDGMDDRRSGGG